MSKLVQMRQRIKAVETIKKITHAMRLISMSTHSRLRNKKAVLEEYKNELAALLNKIIISKDLQTKDFGKNKDNQKKLIILVGSQKGLCGVFNNHLFSFFEQEIKKMDTDTFDFISIGKKAVDFLSDDFGSVIMHFNEFSFKTLPRITKTIVDFILSEKNFYSQVTVFSNWPKTFFAQKSQATPIFPFNIKKEEQPQKETAEEFLWEQPKEKLIEYLKKRHIYLELYTLLLQSLIAEQAARFVAMDSSTRNAKNVLEEMLLVYNKTRQANITRELTDLAGSF